MGVLLRGGKIITAVDSYYADVRIENEKIVAIGNDLEDKEDRIIDCKGCYIMPGGIDTHTHLDLEVGNTVTADNYYTGTRAALAGGTTCIIDYANQNRGETLGFALNNWHKKADGNAWCDYGFHMGITDWNDNVSKEIDDMFKEGVTSFKMYMAYKQTLQVDDGILYKAMKRCNELGGIIGVHCENGDVIEVLVKEAREKGHLTPYYHHKTRPSSVEAEAITRLLSLAEMAQSPIYVVHLSTKEGLNSIFEARKRGVEVYVETCPQYLLLDDSRYGKEESDSFETAKYVMSPPLRGKADNEALWMGLASGQIQTTGTDHCSFNYKGQKELGRSDFSKIPNGGPGIEHRMRLLYTYGVLKNRININKFVEITSTNAAKIYGLFPQKGTIAVGSDADILVWDPEYSSIIKAETQLQNVDYTPYEGFEVKGRAREIILRGEILVSEGEFINNKPSGKYIHRKPCLGR